MPFVNWIKDKLSPYSQLELGLDLITVLTDEQLTTLFDETLAEIGDRDIDLDELYSADKTKPKTKPKRKRLKWSN